DEEATVRFCGEWTRGTGDTDEEDEEDGENTRACGRSAAGLTEAEKGTEEEEGVAPMRSGCETEDVGGDAVGDGGVVKRLFILDWVRMALSDRVRVCFLPMLRALLP